MMAEDAVRAYLTYLQDPSALRDVDEVNRLKAEAESATDPLEKLKLLSAAQRADEVDGSTYEAGFVAHAKEWAERERVTAEAFKALGVPTDVLAAAGLLRRRSAKPSTPSRRTRSQGVPVERVVEAIPGEAFRIRDVMEATGASLQTVRKAVRTLLEQGQLVDLGPDQNWDGRGRTPTLYRRA
jgi:hypothetical protein